METKIALAGNPNCGKTTLFNQLTGSNQYVGNWPGVTVEKKEGRLKGHKDVIIQDLPGIYSLSPYTLEEVVSRNYLVREKPDAILNIVDGTNIERNLYLTTQLIELGLPVVVAVNMIDLVRRNGDQIDLARLGQALGCQVVEMSALKGEGGMAAAERAVAAAQAHKAGELPHVFTGSVEHAIAHIEESIQGMVDDQYLRWYAIKVFERDEKVLESLTLTKDLEAHLEAHIADCENELEDDAESIITNQRYAYINSVVNRAVKKKAPKHSLTTSDKIDRIVTNRVLALPIFVAVMFLIYAIAMGGWAISIGTAATDFTNDTIFGEWVPGFFDSFLLNASGEPVVADWLYGLIQDGIVAGVGAVLGFVPQMLVLFVLLAVLEDVGYMARIAFIMDRIFRRFGLSGKSFIPMLVATGCGVPGIMASRTIEQDRDRKLTIMTTGFIPCGAKMPIIGLFAGAVFGNSAWVATSAYFIGVAAVIVSGIMLKKFKAFAGEPAPFVMELPAYHAPSAGNVLRATWERGWSFIKRAGTVILISSIILWFLQGYGFVDGVFQAVEDNNDSLLAVIGNAIAWIFYPLGWTGSMAWKAAVATFTGLIAKEEVVNTFGVLYHYAGDIDLMEDSSPIWAMVGADFGAISAYSFMIFNLLCAPCFAAMGAIKREMHNTKWTLGAIGYMCLFAYVTAMIVYQIGGLFTGEAAFSVFTVIAIALLAFSVVEVIRMGVVMIPDIGSDQITVSMTLADDIKEQDAYQKADEVMDAMLKVNHVAKVGVLAGGGASIMTSSMGAQQDFTTYAFMILPDETVKKEEQVDAICDGIEAVGKKLDCELTVSSSAMGDMSTMMGSGLQVDVYGNDLDKLMEVSKDIEKLIGQVDGFENITNGQEEGDDVLRLVIDKDKAMRKNLTVAQIYSAISVGLTTEKKAATVTVDGQEMQVDILDDDEKLTRENLMNLELESNTTDDEGKSVTKKYKLKDFAKVEETRGVATIARKNNTRMMQVKADTKEGYNTTKLSEQVQKLLDDYDMPQGYSAEIGGETENTRQMVEQMVKMLALGLLFIYLVMVAQFQSLLSPFIILFTVPLAFTGGLIGLLIGQEQLSIMSLIGFLVLMGTVVNNGIVFVDYVNQLRIAGFEKREALLITGKTRMRPILMTALTTILSMCTLVFSQDTMAGASRGMAIVVAGGLLYATFMTLFIVPVMYDILYRKEPLVVEFDEAELDDDSDLLEV